MPDLIDSAINKATSAARSSATNAASGAIGSAGAAAASATAAAGAASAAAQKLQALPMDKDPDVIKRQAEAKALQVKAQAEEIAMNAEEIAIEEGKKKLNSLKIAGIPIPPKLPLIDPKILGAVALLKKAKVLVELRKKKAKKNLDDGRKLYRYDMKKIKPPAIPNNIQVPPKLPSVPQVPRLPSL